MLSEPNPYRSPVSSAANLEARAPDDKPSGRLSTGRGFDFNLAVTCGALPLVLGALIFVAWAVTRVEWLAYAGLLNIMVGVWLFLLGMLALLFYCVRKCLIDLDRTRRPWRAILLCGLLLVSNFPVAFLIIILVDAIGP